MPDETFLEEYPLYRKFRVEVPEQYFGLADVRIKMPCTTCDSDQTFTRKGSWGFPGAQAQLWGQVFRLEYVCAHCGEFMRTFYIRADSAGQWFMKIGQDPAWRTKGNPEVEKLLGKAHADLYRKALACESQSYGIAANAYYRRIVEEVIDELLDEVSELLASSELKQYEAALEKTKQTTVTRDKIALVKDLLPPILRPGDINPLAVLHSSLSDGLHSGSDEECLEEAAIVRNALVFLVSQVASSRKASRSFTSGMQELLNKRSNRRG
jgi:hypothetical protein